MAWGHDQLITGHLGNKWWFLVFIHLKRLARFGSWFSKGWLDNTTRIVLLVCCLSLPTTLAVRQIVSDNQEKIEVNMAGIAILNYFSLQCFNSILLYTWSSNPPDLALYAATFSFSSCFTAHTPCVSFFFDISLNRPFLLEASQFSRICYLAGASWVRLELTFWFALATIVAVPFCLSHFDWFAKAKRCIGSYCNSLLFKLPGKSPLARVARVARVKQINSSSLISSNASCKLSSGWDVASASPMTNHHSKNQGKGSQGDL